MAMRDCILYTLSEVDRLAGITPGTARRWLGRTGVSGATFDDLIEILVVGGLRKHRLSFAAIRRIANQCREALRVTRPFTSWAFKNEGKQTLEKIGVRNAWESALEPLLVNMDYQDGRVSAWWPLGRDVGIRVAPGWGFGRSVVASRGIRTDILQERWEAGESIADIARDYGLTPAEVASALRFEMFCVKADTFSWR
ncbi:MAG: DUF433 domain-containing protein [Alicyclobacillus sp.]|nr:DUF433 domain-containing protein [Alicyclobacillus sp.]